MTDQPLSLQLSLLNADDNAVLPCLKCSHPIHVQNPVEKFATFKKVPCHRCGQRHQIDLFFQGDKDFCNLIPAAA